MASEPKSYPFLFIRAGDGDNYNAFENIQSAAAFLYDAGAREPLRWDTLCTVKGKGFDGWNYISAYWGEKADDPKRGITRAEVADLNRELARLEHKYSNN